MAVLGFFGASCEKALEAEESEGGMLLMYGSPTVEYTVKGVVTDEEGNPIKGIKVTPVYNDSYSLTTSKKGEFSDAFYSTANCPYYIFEDIDGEKNGGLFAKDTIRANDLKETVLSSEPDPKNPFGHIYMLAEINKKLKKVE